jgi:hypothetical protein
MLPQSVRCCVKSGGRTACLADGNWSSVVCWLCWSTGFAEISTNGPATWSLIHGHLCGQRDMDQCRLLAVLVNGVRGCFHSRSGVA